ncbi:hypothetical protein Tsubulata_039883 [Turnera subulata]|uniref:Endonuclease/exonuclease/phosphatase domain-containing protein n=1 Tax=Turnera subulata TaxID=218843 RepID=A0A9Q0JH56_9ROSI|nr:hypothetical protein Tsubulata_039883 [Turnera subulata]
MVWNCRGAGSSEFMATVKEYVSVNKPQVLILVEPRISGRTADRVVRRIGFSHSHRVEAIGFSGGVWVLWQGKHARVDILANHLQFIHFWYATSSFCICVTAVYACPRAGKRQFLWNNLCSLASGSQEPWLVCGDFNAILHSSEARRVDLSLRLWCRRFQSCVEACDLGFFGPQFTWRRGTSWARIDRALGNSALLVLLSDIRVYHLPILYFDHRPLIIDLCGAPLHRWKVQAGFKFHAAWLTHPSFSEYVSSNWSSDVSVDVAIASMGQSLSQWNTSVFGNILLKKRSLLSRIHGIQSYLAMRPSTFLSNLEVHLQQELRDVLVQEELL